MYHGARGRIARFGLFEADLDRRRLTKNGLRIRIQDQPFQILALLIERRGETVTRDELKERLWAGDTFVAFDDGLNTAIKKLRGALGDTADNPRFVETVPRVGYRFTAPVTVEGPAAAGPPVKETAAPEPAPQNSSGEASQVPPAPPLSNFSRWAWAALVLAVACAGIWMFKEKRSVAAKSYQIDAIAVLPLQNTSADPSQDYLADGMTDEVITDLAKLAGPKVISRTSAMQYKDTRKTVPQIARELRVGAVVEGSVERSGDRMRVRIQLIDAATDQHLWAESYDRQLSDVLDLESAVAKDIAQKIQLHLTSQQQQTLAHNRASDPQAFQDYLQGRQYFAMRTKESLLKSVDYYERAIAKDPNDARSYAGLAHCYIVLPLLYNTPLVEGYAKSRGAADRALALDDSLAEAHLARAEVLFSEDWDFAGAEKEFQRTLALNPNYATGHQWYGEFLSEMGRAEEGIREEQAALALDPLSGVVHHQAGQSFQQAHQYSLALDEYHRALALNPNFISSWEAMSWALRRQGKMAESIEVLRHGMEIWETQYPGITSGFRAMERGWKSNGRNGFLLGAMEFHKRYPRPNLYLARDYAELGRTAEALAALQKSKDAHDPEFLFLLTDPEFDSLRANPEFQQLAQPAAQRTSLLAQGQFQ